MNVNVGVVATLDDLRRVKNTCMTENKRLQKQIASLGKICNRIIICLILIGLVGLLWGMRTSYHVNSLESVTVTQQHQKITETVYGSAVLNKCPECRSAAEVLHCSDGWFCKCTFCGNTSDAFEKIDAAVTSWNNKSEVMI